MMRIVFVNRYYAPDHSATSQILTDLATHLAARGFDVHVVAGDEQMSGGAKLPAEEKRDGVHVHRVSSGGFGRASLARRAADSVVLYMSMYRTVRKWLRPGDILVAKTDPPLLSIPMAQAAKRSGAHLVNWLQDIYPEVASALGVRVAGGIAGRQLTRLRDRSWRAAAMNVAIGDVMAERVLARGIPRERIAVAQNWADDDIVRPIAYRDNPLRAEWSLEGHFTLAYSGNLGRAHEFETLLGAAVELKHRRDIRFLFIGGGHYVEVLQKRAAELGVGESCRYKPYQDRSRLAQSLGAADAHWLSLRPDLEGLIVPSKFYGIAAAGKPTIAIVAQDGEIARLIHRYDCGVVITPGDSRKLAEVLTGMADRAGRGEEWGRNARRMIDAAFSKASALENWEKTLLRVAERPIISPADAGTLPET